MGLLQMKPLLQVEALEDRCLPSFGFGFGSTLTSIPAFNLGSFDPGPAAPISVRPPSDDGSGQGAAVSPPTTSSISPPLGGIGAMPPVLGWDPILPPGGFWPPIPIPPIPIPPILFVNDAYYTTPVGWTLTVDASNGLLAGAFDLSGGTLQVTEVNGSAANVGTALTLASGATLTVNADGSFRYVPATGFQGNDSFGFTVSDGTKTASATATVNVQPPVLFVGDAYYDTGTGQTLTEAAADGLLSGVYDSSGNTVQVSAVNGSAANVGMALTLASGATLTVNADGSFTYVPATGFQGDDSFTFTASDGTISTNATATITVQPPFLFVSDAYYTTPVGQTLTVNASNGLLSGAYDSSGNWPISFAASSNNLQISAVNGSAANVGTAITLTSGATLTVNADGSFTYVPASGFQGDDTFTFTVSDGTTSQDATATISVLAPFVSVSDAYYATSSGQTLQVDASDGLLAGAYDSSGNTLQITAVNGAAANVGTPVTLASGATLTVNADGSFTYVPASGFQGNDSFTFTAGDGTTSADATATINVLPPLLFVHDVYYTAVAGQTLTVAAANGLLSDPLASGWPISFNPVGTNSNAQISAVNGSAANVGTAITLASGATLTVNADGSFTYVPAAGFQGNDSFTFTASAGTATASATATINVQAPELYLPDAHFFDPSNQTLNIDASGGLLAQAKDPTGGTLQITAINGSAANVGTAITLASGATLTVNADGSFIYVPGSSQPPIWPQGGPYTSPPVFLGGDSFTFTAGDGTLTATATATITDLPILDPPWPVPPFASAWKG